MLLCFEIALRTHLSESVCLERHVGGVALLGAREPKMQRKDLVACPTTSSGG